MKEIFERVKTQWWFEYRQSIINLNREGWEEIMANQDEASEKALRFTVNDRHYWFPKSQISCLVDPDKVSHYYAPKWMIKQKEL